MDHLYGGDRSHLVLTITQCGYLHRTLDAGHGKDITERMAHTSYDSYHQETNATYSSWLTNDITSINELGYDVLATVIQQFFNLVFSILVLFKYHFSLLFTVAFFMIWMLLVPRLFTKKLNERSVKVTKKNEKLMQAITDVLEGFDTLFMLNKRQKIVTKTEMASQNLMESKVSYAQTMGNMSATINLVSLLSQLAILAHAGLLFAAKLVPIGAVSTASYFASNVFSSLTGLTLNLAEMKTVQPIFDKFKELAVTNKEADQLQPFTTSLTVEKLAFAYPDRSELFKNKSFQLKKGKKYALVGPSGVGKSTLLNILAGKIDHYAGSIQLDGRDYHTISADTLHEEIFLIDQAPYIFNESLLENITLGQPISEERLTQIIQQAGLNDWLTSLPAGIHTVLRHQGTDISGGQKQRIVYARGLVAGRKFILMDEGTASLDQDSAQFLENALACDPDLTLLMATHHLPPEIKAKMDAIFILV